jgi:peptidoglycan/xylan/chitin deacetylase (PgdA/CDA1 family)
MFQNKFNIFTIFTIVLLLHVIAGIFFNNYHPLWVGLIVLGYLILLVLGSFFIRWNFYVKSRNKLPLFQIKFGKEGMSLAQNQKAIALTFDDGPNAQTEAVLDILKKEKIPATFFLIGKNIEGKENILLRMEEEGHEIGGHSYNHANNFDWQSSKNMSAEIERTNKVIESITGQKVRLFRPPFGVTNPNLSKAIRTAGMLSVGWTIRSLDTVAKSEEKLLAKITRKLKPGSIILLHDHCPITLKILPGLIASAKERGFRFIKI